MDNDNSGPKRASASSTPIKASQGGVHKFVRATKLDEVSVSNQERSFGNVNVECINTFCNCSHPFELTAARLFLFPASTQGGDIFTIAFTVMLALDLLLLTTAHACQRSVGTAPSPPPVVLLRRRELPQSESGDDPFIRELKRRRNVKARFRDHLCGKISTRGSVSIDEQCVAGVAIQCDAAQTTPSEAGPQEVATVAKTAQRDTEPPTIVGVQRSDSALGKSPTSVPRRSSQSAIEDENLDEAAIESSSKAASGTGDSTVIVGSVDVAVTSSSIASTTAAPAGNTATSSKAAKTMTSVGNHGASEETPRTATLRLGRWLGSTV